MTNTEYNTSNGLAICLCLLSRLLVAWGFTTGSDTTRISVLWPEVGRCADIILTSGGVRDA